MVHYSVMLHEAIDGLNLKSNSIVVDATLGYAGHASHILKSIPAGHLYGFDEDSEAIKYADDVLSKIGKNYTIIHSNYANLKKELNKLGIDHVDAILFDLGVSSPQIDNATRGFSFMHDGNLDMRMDQGQALSADVVVNTYSLKNLVNIFYEYGEEPKSKIIAEHIINNRPLKTTKELVKVIEGAVGAKYFNLNHPERRIFQAIRIEVNDELNSLRKALPASIELLNKGGRVSVITFHSLEDRIVKKYFKENSEVNELVKGLPEVPIEYQPKIKLINKKPILASPEELAENSRSKSAKLRVIERI
jgi:16S rRNA (cytosine1402-N4)-methyltransferase